MVLTWMLHFDILLLVVREKTRDYAEVSELADEQD